MYLLRRDMSMLQASIRLLSLLVVMPLLFGETQGMVKNCDVGWIQRGQTCYKVVNTMKMSWSDAQVFCNAAGGTLAYIKNSDENAIARQLASSYSTNCLWIGVLDLNNDRHWVSSSSHRPVTFTDWAPGEPNNHVGRKENCVCLYAALNYHWNDEPCTTQGDFLCQKKIY